VLWHRSLANVKWNPRRRLVELGNARQKRYFFNVAMAKKFMQTLLVSDACKELIDAGKTTSIRDLYYITKHSIGDTKQNTFEEQDESDPIIEDLEVTLDSLRQPHLRDCVGYPAPSICAAELPTIWYGLGRQSAPIVRYESEPSRLR
jgi:DNA topoisomerase VI subunit A